MIVLDRLPVIFTKDQAWLQQFAPIARGGIRAGQFILLPEDAVLVDLVPSEPTSGLKLVPPPDDGGSPA